MMRTQQIVEFVTAHFDTVVSQEWANLQMHFFGTQLGLLCFNLAHFFQHQSFLQTPLVNTLVSFVKGISSKPPSGTANSWQILSIPAVGNAWFT
jgi:hypothetical protein